MGCISGEVLYSFEKKGGNIRHLAEMDAFRQVSESCSLYDITASRLKFMWDNCRRGTSNVKKRLDRFMATPSWAAMWNNYRRGTLKLLSQTLLANKELAILSKELENGEKFTNLLTAIGAYAKGLSLDSTFRMGKGTRLPLDSRINFALFNSFTIADYVAAQCLRRGIMYYHMEIFKNVDVIVTPTTGILIQCNVEFCKSEMKVQCSHTSRIYELALPASKRPKQQDVPKRARLRESIRQR
ncbi:fatty acid amide hydrolase-like protein [Tanacetum coccineum]